MKFIFLFLLGFPLLSCNSQVSEINKVNTDELRTIELNEDSVSVCKFFEEHQGNDFESKEIGSVSNGSLQHGKLIPFYGENYTYFDINSYLGSRAFTSNITRDIILDSYKQLAIDAPTRHFQLMELSNEHGGKMYPHRTHQNGLSVDFMMPMLQSGYDYYGLDTLGVDHYWLKFNNNGEFLEDTTVKVDFNVIAQHLLILNSKAKDYGYKISKVIIKVEYKDELFATEYGKKLQSSGIYIVKNLTPLINEIHDDHYHVDFEKL